MHFTYAPPDRNSLFQGDLLGRTPELVKTLEDVHPHFAQAKYVHFLVLTQSCDLVRRDASPCKARYITIAAVRPLREALRRELERHQYDEVERELGFCETSRKQKLVQFMERLVNNNESDYFFLYEGKEFGLIESHCAFLQLSVPLKASLHYNTLLGAKVLQLTDSFQHKLGWLVGGIYSRIGTDDWLPDNCDRAYFKQLINKPLEDSELVTWLDKDVHKKTLTKLKGLEANERTQDALLKAIEEVKAEQGNRLDAILDVIRQELTGLEVGEDLSSRLLNRLGNNASFTARVK